jgi:hypothetical protein
MTLKIIGIAIASMMLLTGCSVRLGDFTALSTKNIPYRFVKKGPGQGEDIARIIIIFPTKAAPNIKEATDRAIEQANGDALVNAKVYYRNWYIPYIYGEVGYEVKGDGVSTEETMFGKNGRNTSGSKRPASAASPTNGTD